MKNSLPIDLSPYNGLKRLVAKKSNYFDDKKNI